MADEGLAALYLIGRQLCDCGGEVLRAKSTPVDDTVTACPRSAKGDSFARRSWAKASKAGNATSKEVSMISKAKGYLNSDYHREMRAVYCIFR